MLPNTASGTSILQPSRESSMASVSPTPVATTPPLRLNGRPQNNFNQALESGEIEILPPPSYDIAAGTPSVGNLTFPTSVGDSFATTVSSQVGPVTPPAANQASWYPPEKRGLHPTCKFAFYHFLRFVGSNEACMCVAPPQSPELSGTYLHPQAGPSGVHYAQAGSSQAGPRGYTPSPPSTGRSNRTIPSPPPASAPFSGGSAGAPHHMPSTVPEEGGQQVDAVPAAGNVRIARAPTSARRRDPVPAPRKSFLSYPSGRV